MISWGSLPGCATRKAGRVSNGTTSGARARSSTSAVARARIWEGSVSRRAPRRPRTWRRRRSLTVFAGHRAPKQRRRPTITQVATPPSRSLRSGYAFGTQTPVISPQSPGNRGLADTVQKAAVCRAFPVNRCTAGSACHAEGRGFKSLQPLSERPAFAGLFGLGSWLVRLGRVGLTPDSRAARGRPLQ
jgi:hypothetical protein